MTLISSPSAPTVGPAARAALVPAPRRPPPSTADGPVTRQRRALALVAVDAAAVAVGLVTATPAAALAGHGRTLGGVGWESGCLFGGAWLVALGLAGCYRAGWPGRGTAEYQRVATATGPLWLAGVLAVHLARAVTGGGAAPAGVSSSWLAALLGLTSPLGTAPPLGLAALLAGRGLVRRCRPDRHVPHRVVVVGDPRSAATLAATLRREPRAGLAVVGCCPPTPVSAPVSAPVDAPVGAPPVLGSVRDVPAVAAVHRAAAVLVAAGDVPSDQMRRLCRALAGRGVDVLVAPGPADVAAWRVSVRPVAGLPLLHVASAADGWQRLVKVVADRVLAGLGLLLLGPVLLAVAAAVRLSSPGPALFRQTRCGRDGRPFRMVKFRTMYADAEQRLADLCGRNESDGPLFKIRNDPRITPLGRLLRRTSLDELPQLLNVLCGQMSLVGPRPLPVDDSAITGEARRRLTVRPGITGLWQVSGRSALGWQETVRLDLYYVDNWSLRLDLGILARTAGAVIRGVGAY